MPARPAAGLWTHLSLFRGGELCRSQVSHERGVCGGNQAQRLLIVRGMEEHVLRKRSPQPVDVQLRDVPRREWTVDPDEDGERRAHAR